MRTGLALFGLACAIPLCGFGTHARADDASSATANTSEWQFNKPSGKVTELFQLYNQRIQGLQDDQERLDAELEFSASHSAFGFKAVPWAWVRVPQDIGGQQQQARVFGDFKEAWAEHVGDVIDIRAGNQIFGWGTADQVNPTDVWNPRDMYDIFQSPKLPIAALDIKIHPPQFERASLEIIGTPFFRPSSIPLLIPDSGTQPFTVSDSRWFLPFPTTVIASNGSFVAPLQYQITQPTYPSTWQAGARLRVTSIGGWDFSASYANIVESLPRFSFTTSGNASSPSLPVVITLNPSYHREQMFGLDGAGSFKIGDSEIGTRFEGAYFARDNSRAYQAPQAQQADLLRDDYIHVVAGLDYTFRRKILGTVLYVNLQYVHYQRFGTLEQSPGQYVISGLPDVLPWDRNLVFYWEDRIGQDSQLKILGTVVSSLVNGDALISPAIQYAWTDNLKTQLGAEIFAGAPAGFFGQFGQDSRFDFGATYSF